MNKKILIINYHFAPNNAVGAKRWSNLSKYLKGDLHLLTNEKEPDKLNFVSTGIINSKYPKVLDKKKFSFIEKLIYRFQLVRLGFLVKGTVYDRGKLDEKVLTNHVLKILEEQNVDAIIVSGAPFSYLYYMAKLKSKLGGVKLISDLRDPWSWGVAYGFSNLSEKRLNYEKACESLVMNNSDIITVPSESMKLKLNQLYPKLKDKFILVPHGFDSAKIDASSNILNSSSKVKGRDEVLKFLYAGTVYENCFQEYESFTRRLMSIKANFKFEIFTSSACNSRIDSLHVNSLINEEELFGLYKSHNFFVLAFNERVKDFLSAKIFEIIYCGLPIIYLGPKGKLFDFISANNLGYAASDLSNEELKQLIEKKERTNYSRINDYDFANLAKKVNKIIE